MATNQISLQSNDDTGKLVLRVSLAVLLLFPGVAELTGGIGFVSTMLANVGLPAFLGYLVYVGEIVAPLMILAGVATRAAAAVVAINMVVAVGLVHMGELFKLSATGGWALELQGMFLFAAIAVALLGAGRFSVAGASGRFN